MREWFVLTFLMGAFFIGGQIYEYANLVHEGLSLSSRAYGSVFYITTGFHGLHVAIGVALILWCFLRQVFTKCFTPSNHIALQNVALYWHFVDLVWVFVFTFFYLV